MREGRFTDQKSSSVLSLHTDYLNIDSISGCGKNGKETILSRQRALFVEILIILQIFLKDQKRKEKISRSW